VRVSAVDAAAAGGGREAVPALIGLLADEHWYVRNTAHAALTKSSGQQLPADLAAWRNWWEKEGKNAPAAPK
jgi:HEAT repeat protein